MKLTFVHKRRIFLSFFILFLILGSILLGVPITQEKEEPIELHCATCSP